MNQDHDSEGDAPAISPSVLEIRRLLAEAEQEMSYDEYTDFLFYVRRLVASYDGGTPAAPDASGKIE